MMSTAANISTAAERRRVYREYLRSVHWQRLRTAVIKRDGCCRDCGSRRRLAVHHLTYKRLGKERLSDLVTLCRDCHYERHNGKVDVPPATMLEPLEEWLERQGWRHRSGPISVHFVNPQTLRLADDRTRRSHSVRAIEAEARRSRLDQERQERERSKGDWFMPITEVQRITTARLLA